MFFENKKVLNILRIAFAAIFMFLIVSKIFHHTKTETNILKAIFSDNGHSNILVDLSNRASSKINLIVESDNPEEAENFAKMIYYKIDKNKLKISDVNLKAVLDTYAQYQNNLLSKDCENLLINKDYDAVAEKALVHLYNPIMAGFNVAPLDKDPFLLVTDYIMSLEPDGNHQLSNFTPIMYDGKYYSLIALEVKNEYALSPTIINSEVKKLVDIQKEFTQDKIKVYLTGTPVHSYFASTHSIFEINLICILSLIFITGLVLLYFRSLRPLLPIAISILLGISAGYLMTSLVFPSIHILTFVFSTTLIGICIDYSLHFFVAKDKDEECLDVVKEIFKSLSVSLLTTVCAFLVLLLAGFELLKQISVFTITGLVTVYLFVILFYPVICKNAGHRREHNFQICIPDNIRIPLIGLCLLIGFFGLTKLTYDDNIKNMYTPPDELMRAEQVYHNAFNPIRDISFIVVKADGFQDLMEKEEAVTDVLFNKAISYQSISKFIPSAKRQIANQGFRKELYKAKLNSYAKFLPQSVRTSLINQNYDGKYFSYNKNFEFLKDLKIDDNTSVIVVYNFHDNDLLKKFNNIQIVNLQNDISLQIKKCRKLCFSLLIPIFVLLYLILAKIYDFKSAAQIITPSILASVFTLGLFGLFNQPINMFHVLAIFLIIGFGLDYSVFKFCGAKKSEDAVLISCLTTVFSFTLLAFAGFKLISSLGIVLAVGLISSYVLSLACIPDEKQS